MNNISIQEFEKLLQIPEFVEPLKNYPPISDPLELFLRTKDNWWLEQAYKNFMVFLSTDADMSFQKSINFDKHFKFLKRRKFLKQATVLGAVALGAGVFGWEMVFTPDQKEVKKNLQNVLKEFISGSSGYSLPKEEIKGLLYTVFHQGNERLRFKALHLGDGLFLTVNHYNDALKIKNIKIESMRLVQQTAMTLFSYEDFREIHTDKMKDLALLYAPKMKLKGKAVIQLNAVPPKEKEECSIFRIVDGYEPKEFELIGKEYFNGSGSLRLGKEIFHKKTWFDSNQLFEKRGFVLPYSFISKLFARHPDMSEFFRPSDLFLITILGEGGDSGTPVFRKLEGDKFQLIGVLSGQWTEKNGVPMENHPFHRGYKGVQQTGAFSINNTAIREFILECIKKLD